MDLDLAIRDFLLTLVPLREPALLVDLPLLWIAAASMQGYYAERAGGDAPGYKAYAVAWARDFLAAGDGEGGERRSRSRGLPPPSIIGVWVLPNSSPRST